MTNKLDFSKPEELQTRDGRAVRIYATDAGSDYPIHGAIFNTVDSTWEICSWAATGALRCGSEVWSLGDLVRKPQRVKGWLNVYRNGSCRYAMSDLFESQIEARKRAANNCHGQIYIDAEIQT